MRYRRRLLGSLPTMQKEIDKLKAEGAALGSPAADDLSVSFAKAIVPDMAEMLDDTITDLQWWKDDHAETWTKDASVLARQLETLHGRVENGRERLPPSLRPAAEDDSPMSRIDRMRSKLEGLDAESASYLSDL